MYRLLAWSLLLISGSLFVGCGRGDAKRINDLKQTGLAWHMHHDQHHIGPKSWDELIATASGANMSAEPIQRVRDAGYEMTWGVKLSEATAGTSNTVLAKPPGDGGPTLMLDGSVRR